MLGTKLEAFAPDTDEDSDSHDYIKSLVRHKRSEMMSHAAWRATPSDKADVPMPFVVQRAQGGLAMNFADDAPRLAVPPRLPRVQPRRRCDVSNLDQVPEEQPEGSSPPAPPPKKQAQAALPVVEHRPPLRARDDNRREHKSDCVAKVEALQVKREARRKRAVEAKQQREREEAAALEAGVGVEHVDFLRILAQQRREQGLGIAPPQPRPHGASHIWQDRGVISRIRVVIRKRPMLKPERLRHDVDIVDVSPSLCRGAGDGPAANDAIHVHEPITRVDCSKGCATQSFAFDAAFSEADSTEDVYEAAVRPLVDHVVHGSEGHDSGGGTATVFAFGATGSGKTLTMSGMYAHCARDLLTAAAARGMSVSMAVFEIYRGGVFDLLHGRAKLDVQEDAHGKVCVVGLAEEAVDDVDAFRQAVVRAEEHRAVGATSANEASSRSHALVQMRLRRGARNPANGSPGERALAGTLTLVDLAGSERACDSSAMDRQTRIEGAEINKSLLALKECIRALDAHVDAPPAHVPFRGSKLTHVLRDAFVGDARTLMIATVAPGAAASEHTLGTLRYAQRVRTFGEKLPQLQPTGRGHKQRARAFGGMNRIAKAAPRSAPELSSPSSSAATPSWGLSPTPVRSSAVDEEMSAAGPLVLPPLVQQPERGALGETKQGW